MATTTDLAAQIAQARAAESAAIDAQLARYIDIPATLLRDGIVTPAGQAHDVHQDWSDNTLKVLWTDAFGRLHGSPVDGGWVTVTHDSASANREDDTAKAYDEATAVNDIRTVLDEKCRAAFAGQDDAERGPQFANVGELMDAVDELGARQAAGSAENLADENALMSPVDQVLAYLSEQNVTPDVRFFAAAIREVMALHREHRIYEPCGHTHQPDEPGVRDVDEVGLVCEDGYIYSICWCCCTDSTSYQSEACASNHEGCWPCSTVWAIAEGLGIEHHTSEQVAS